MARGNNFRFKQFEIIQQRSAMKVGTDGVLLGAWANLNKVANVLDIGTGTGLIALMIAQRCDAVIDAVELEENAFEEAQQNFSNSPWSERLGAVHDSIISYAETSSKQYDCIVCNPPFFTNGNRAPKKERSVARHTDGLPFHQLISSAEKLLNPEGWFEVVIPTDVENEFSLLCEGKGLFLIRRTQIKPNDTRPIKRVLLSFCRNKTTTLQENFLQIEMAERHQYTEEYKALTQDFYLAF